MKREKNKKINYLRILWVSGIYIILIIILVLNPKLVKYSSILSLYSFSLFSSASFNTYVCR